MVAFGPSTPDRPVATELCSCVSCPRDAQDNPMPAACKNSHRYDHQLSVEDLGALIRDHLASDKKQKFSDFVHSQV